MNAVRRVLVGALAAAFLALPATLAHAAPAEDEPVEVDRRDSGVALVAPTAAQVAAAETLGAEVRWNGQTGAPRSVLRRGGALTEPSGEPAEAVARGFLADQAALWGFTAQDLGNLELRNLATDGATGARRVWLQQVTDDGREVFDAVLLVVVDGQGRVVFAGGPVVPGLTVPDPEVEVTEEEAPDVAAESAGEEPAGDLEPLPSSEPGVSTYVNEYADATPDPAPVTVEPVVFPVAGSKTARVGWRTDVMGDDEWYDSVVDAATGEILYRDSRWHDNHGPEGNVFREQHPQIPGAAQQITSFAGLDNAWVTDNRTAGNNANVCHDPTGDDACDYQTATPASGDPAFQHFNYNYTDAISTSGGTDITTDRDAVLTQAFYYVNRLHDFWYGYGFTEAERNFQNDNFGRGGTGNDRVNVLVDWAFDDGECCNARMATPADGTNPRLELRVGLAPDDRDMHRAMNGDTVTHEYGHGVSNRLVGDGAMGSGTQTDALGEGWSDAQSFALWGDPVYGEYNNGDTTTGIRRVAYNTSTWTYSTLCNPGCQEHADGEIWATALWDVRQHLVDTYGAASGADRFARLMIQGMINTTGTPDFLDARDGVLTADQLVYANADFCGIWQAFATNGMGSNASSASQSMVTEGFEVPAACRPTADAGGPYSVAEGSTVQLNATGSTSGSDASAGAIVSYEWDLDGDTEYDDATGATPTFGPRGDNGSQTVAVRVTTDAGTSDTDDATVTITNVDPAVAISATQVTGIDEGGTVTVDATFSDPGWLDTYSATIDWGTGDGPQAAASAVTTSGGPGVADQGTVSGSKTYGDNGNYTVTVRVTDDDGGTGMASFNVAVGNVRPTAGVDPTGAQIIDGVPVFLNEAGQPITLSARSTDPGSDDLTFRWPWGDGTPDSVSTHLVNPPLPDPFPSPSVQPRDVTDTQTHTFGEACLYTIAVTSTDDDGGVSDPSLVKVISVGNDDTTRGAGFWYNQYRAGGGGKKFTDVRLGCYLDIVNTLSTVFSEARTVTTKAQGEAVLKGVGPSARDKLDRALLAAWLNLANGAVGYDEVVDTNGDGTPDTVFSAVLATAESVRLDAGSTTPQMLAQKDILERINERDS